MNLEILIKSIEERMGLKAGPLGKPHYDLPNDGWQYKRCELLTSTKVTVFAAILRTKDGYDWEIYATPFLTVRTRKVLNDFYNIAKA